MAYLDALPPDLRPEYALVNEARAIHDTAMLRPADYLPAAGPAWIVAVVNPGSGSGSATVPGAHIEAETGRFLAPSQAEAVVVKTGSWQAVAASNPSEPMGGPYSWTEPLERSVRMPAPEDYYSPFAYGGTIVFRPEPSAGGAEFFGDCGMIFPEWGRSAADALRASPRLTTVFAQAPSDPAALTETARTINGPNGVLAAIAFRMLLDGPVPFASRAATVTHTGDLRKLSVFVYLILFGSTAKDYGEWLAEIRRLVDETGDPERLLAIARAGFAASLFATRNPPAAAAARQMLDDLRRRADQLGMPRREDSQLFLILKKTGLL